MSKLSFATADSLLSWLKKLAGTRRLVAPRQEGPSVLFRAQKAEELKDLPGLLRRATASPKECILPKSEVLLRFSATKKEDDPGRLNMSLTSPNLGPNTENSGETILFGGRPCDARGFVVLDRPYLEGKYKDPYYKARRDATLIVTQACPGVCTGCFCNWVGSHPADPEGSDILFSAVDNGFVLEAYTDKGRELLDSAGFPEGEDRRGDLEAAHNKVAESLAPAPALDKVPAKVAAMFHDEAFWIKHTAKCLSCGICTYLCPTCQCFTVTDEGTALEGKRMRSWDSCMTSQFTLEASGHNPRADKARRMRQRISHKFSYYPENYAGNYSCCGCGRCVISCPVSLDIRQVMSAAVLAAPAVPDSPAAAPKAVLAKGKASPKKSSAKSAKKTTGKE